MLHTVDSSMFAWSPPCFAILFHKICRSRSCRVPAECFHPNPLACPAASSCYRVRLVKNPFQGIHRSNDSGSGETDFDCGIAIQLNLKRGIFIRYTSIITIHNNPILISTPAATTSQPPFVTTKMLRMVSTSASLRCVWLPARPNSEHLPTHMCLDKKGWRI